METATRFNTGFVISKDDNRIHDKTLNETLASVYKSTVSLVPYGVAINKTVIILASIGNHKPNYKLASEFIRECLKKVPLIQHKSQTPINLDDDKSQSSVDDSVIVLNDTVNDCDNKMESLNVQQIVSSNVEQNEYIIDLETAKTPDQSIIVLDDTIDDVIIDITGETAEDENVVINVLPIPEQDFNNSDVEIIELDSNMRRVSMTKTNNTKSKKFSRILKLHSEGIKKAYHRRQESKNLLSCINQNNSVVSSTARNRLMNYLKTNTPVNVSDVDFNVNSTSNSNNIFNRNGRSVNVLTSSNLTNADINCYNTGDFPLYQASWPFNWNLPDPSISTFNVPNVNYNINNVGNNIYNSVRVNRTGLRTIIIDGSNVAMGHGNNAIFSVKGLEICIDYFEKRGHVVKTIIPHFRLNHNQSNNPYRLQQMEKSRKIICTPSRIISGGKRIASYDDRYIVQIAAEFEGIIVSNDNFRDLLQENPNWKDTIEKRLLMFTWFENCLMFPQDPLGRDGPSLEQLLRF